MSESTRDSALDRAATHVDDHELERLLRGVERIAEGLDGIKQLVLQGPAIAAAPGPFASDTSAAGIIRAMERDVEVAFTIGATHTSVSVGELAFVLRTLRRFRGQL